MQTIIFILLYFALSLIIIITTTVVISIISFFKINMRSEIEILIVISHSNKIKEIPLHNMACGIIIIIIRTSSFYYYNNELCGMYLIT